MKFPTKPKGGLVKLLKERIEELENKVFELEAQLAIASPMVITTTEPKTQGIITKIKTRRKLRRIVEAA